ncbi:zinc finger homeobox protein 4 [Tachysurus ichikawai]
MNAGTLPLATHRDCKEQYATLDSSDCAHKAEHLQKQESACSSDSCSFYCALCDYSSKAKLNLVQHQRSLKHQQSEGLRKLQLHQQGLPLEEDNLAEIFFIKDCPQAETDPERFCST